MARCWVYTLAYNSAELLPHFLHYHGAWADRIVVYDNGSTDDTAALARAAGAEVRPYNHLTGDTLRDDVHAGIKNACWKEARGQADWVVVADLDEFVYHPRLLGYLDDCAAAGVTVPLTTAYEMVGPAWPAAGAWLTDVVRRGVRNDLYSKFLVFDPNAVAEIHYGPGGHSARPRGRVVFSAVPCRRSGPVPPYPPLIRQLYLDERGCVPPPHPLKVLHYRFVGPDRVARMWAAYRPRTSAVNQAHGWGRHYDLPAGELDRVYRLLLAEAEPVVG